MDSSFYYMKASAPLLPPAVRTRILYMASCVLPLGSMCGRTQAEQHQTGLNDTKVFRKGTLLSSPPLQMTQLETSY